MISVPDAATLSALETRGLSNGELAYVQTYRDYFFLHQFNSLDLVTDEILPVNRAPFGRWIRMFEPARCWLEEGPFYVSGSGSGEAPGTNPKEPIPLQEFHRRVLSQLDRVSSGTAITCFVVGNISGDVQVTSTAPSFGADAPSVTFDGSLGRSPLFSGTLTGAHAVDLGNVATAAAPSPWTVTMNPGGVAPLNWTPYLQKIAHVTSGPRAGTQFRILADLGGGTALIGRLAEAGAATGAFVVALLEHVPRSHYEIDFPHGESARVRSTDPRADVAHLLEHIPRLDHEAVLPHREPARIRSTDPRENYTTSFEHIS